MPKTKIQLFRAIFTTDEGEEIKSEVFTLKEVLTTYGFEFKFEEGSTLPLSDVDEDTDIRFEFIKEIIE